MLASAALPPEGLGIEVCSLHAATGLPCPGCGLTRAFIAVVAGDAESATALHPFVWLIFPLVGVIALVGLLPSGARARVAQKLDDRWRAVRRAGLVGLSLFVAFGVARFGVFAWTGARFP